MNQQQQQPQAEGVKISDLLANSPYICKEMLWDSPPVEVVVARVEAGHQVPKPGSSKRDRKCVLFFEKKKKGLVLNARNTKFLIRTLGTTNTAAWVGKRLVLYVDKSVKMGSAKCGGIRMAIGQLYSGDQAPPGFKPIGADEAPDFTATDDPPDDDWDDATIGAPSTTSNEDTNP